MAGAFHCIRCNAEIDRSFKACPHCGEPVTEFLRRYADEPVDGKYKIVERLGTGGMGEVYKVTHTYLGATRVIKVIRPQISDSDDANDRFLREARAATKVQHPNVATLHDFSALPDGSHYMVWEYIEGENLAQRIHARGVLPPRYAVELAIQTLHGLEAIHRAGIVHRDISPENLMIARDADGEERIKIIDMGVAKIEDATENVTRAGVFVGKLRYASPEHLGFLQENEKIDARADLYSVGVVLYEMLTGRPPYEATSPHQYVMLHSRDTHFKPLDVSGTLPGGAQLQAVLAKALDRDRNKRFATAREFAAALEDIERTLPDPSSQQTMAIPAPATTMVQTPRPDTLHRSTVRTGVGAPANTTVRTPLPGPLPGVPAQPNEVVARQEASSAGAILIVGAILLVALAAIAFLFLRNRSSNPPAVTTRQPATTIAQQNPPPAQSQTHVDVVSPAPVTTTTAAPVPPPPQTTTTAATETTAPQVPKKKRPEQPVEQTATTATEAPIERPAPAAASNVRAYVDGGDSGSNEQVLSDARQRLHGTSKVAVHANNSEMSSQLTKALQRQGLTVTDGADTVIDFDGTLERAGFGRKRRSAKATITKNGRVVFRYELPSEEYRVGDTPAEAFARVASDAFH